jgi:hypothetical protein
VCLAEPGGRHGLVEISWAGGVIAGRWEIFGRYLWFFLILEVKFWPFCFRFFVVLLDNLVYPSLFSKL